MKKFIVSILLLVLLAGCNLNQNAEDINRENENTTGTTSVSNRFNNQEYITKGWTMDEQNPNFLNTADDNRINNQADIDKAREVVNLTGEYQAGSVLINGKDMWVTAYKKGNLSERERIDGAAELHKTLVKALPRYHIEVEVRDDRT